MPSVKLASSDSAQVIRLPADPSGTKVTASRSVRSSRGRALTGRSARRTTLVGRNCRMCEYDHRVRGNFEKLLSAKRIILSGGGGAPTIQPMRTGSLSTASRRSAIEWTILLAAVSRVLLLQSSFYTWRDLVLAPPLPLLDRRQPGSI